MHEEASSNNVEKGRRKRKERKPCQQESETSTCMNVPDSHEEKSDENQGTLDLSLASIEGFKNENKDMKKLVQISDEKEHEYKEEIVSLKTQLEEARRLEKVLSSKFKERDLKCKRLEGEVDSDRSKLAENNRLCKHLEEDLASMKKSAKATINDDTEATLKGPTKEESNDSILCK